MVPLPDSDDMFSSSDEENDKKESDLPLHPKLEPEQVYDVIVTTALNPSNFYVSEMEITDEILNTH